jgi:hypothetical protein
MIGRAVISAAMLTVGLGASSQTDAQSWPGNTTSHYVQNSLSDSAFWQSGCDQAASSNAIVILDFGQPWISGSTWGAQYWYYGGGRFLSTATIADYVEDWATGYYQCSDAYHYITVAAGINSDSSHVSSNHAQAWSTMVDGINVWLANAGYSGRVTAAGAIDAEPGFYASASSDRKWAGGYATTSAFYDFGSADGCSWTGYSAPPGGACNSGWHQDDEWYMSWGAPAAYPLPEVYDSYTITLSNGTTDRMAQQWEMIRLYGYHYKTGAIFIEGTMSTTVGVSPSTSWSYMYVSVTHYSPVQSSLPWSTKIVWGL